MPTVEIPASRFAEFIRERLQRDTDLVRKVALETALRGEAAAVAQTNKVGAVDMGHFKNAWSHRRIPKGAELGNSAPYADVIEHGRRPGRPGPPLAPIEEWVERKLVPNGLVEAKDAKSVAYAIRRSIHIKGTKPRLILTGLMPKLREWFLLEAVRRLRAQG